MFCGSQLLCLWLSQASRMFLCLGMEEAVFEQRPRDRLFRSSPDRLLRSVPGTGTASRSFSLLSVSPGCSQLPPSLPLSSMASMAIFPIQAQDPGSPLKDSYFSSRSAARGSWRFVCFHSHKIPHFDSSLRKTPLPGFSVAPSSHQRCGR